MKIRNIFIMIFTTLFLFACGGGGGGDKGDGGGELPNIVTTSYATFQIDEYESELPEGFYSCVRISNTVVTCSDMDNNYYLYTYKDSKWEEALDENGTPIVSHNADGILRISDTAVRVFGDYGSSLYQYKNGRWTAVITDCGNIERVSDTAVSVSKLETVALYHYVQNQWKIVTVDGVEVKKEDGLQPISETMVIGYENNYSKLYFYDGNNWTIVKSGGSPLTASNFDRISDTALYVYTANSEEYLYYYKNNQWHKLDGVINSFYIQETQVIMIDANGKHSLWVDNNGTWEKHPTIKDLDELTMIVSDSVVISGNKLLVYNESSQAWEAAQYNSANIETDKNFHPFTSTAVIEENASGQYFLYFRTNNGWDRITFLNDAYPFSNTILCDKDVWNYSPIYYYTGSAWVVAQENNVNIEVINGMIQSAFNSNVAFISLSYTTSKYTIYSFDGTHWAKSHEGDIIYELTESAFVLKDGDTVGVWEYDSNSNEWIEVASYNNASMTYRDEPKLITIISDGKTYLIYPKAD